MNGKERVAAIRAAGFTRFDKTLDSKCQKPELYGVRLTEGAANALRERIKRPAEQHRKKEGKITYRVTKQQKARLQLAQERKGYSTLQTYLDVEVFFPLFKELGIEDANDNNE